MKIKTLEDRLEIYEIALTEFLLAKMADFHPFELVTYGYGGLCGYIKDRINIYCYAESMARKLPELYQTRPKHTQMYWFDLYNISSRIACLKRAIKITENKIKKQEKTLVK